MKLSNPQIRLVQLAAFILTAILPSIALADVDDDRGKRKSNSQNVVYGWLIRRRGAGLGPFDSVALALHF